MKLRTILHDYKWRFIGNLLLIGLEAIIILSFPLFIGFAIDDALNGAYLGAIQLGLLGVGIILIGGGRRFFDSRLYAKIYHQLGLTSINKMDGQPVSKKTARLDMLRELVEFLENALPELITNIIGLIGVVIIIIGLNSDVFLASLIATFLVFLIYLLSSQKTVRLNKGFNDEMEIQVDVVAKNDPHLLSTHLKKMMKWNIKLSDLEVLNFSISWIVLIGFLVISILLSVHADAAITSGKLFSLIMYVFQYIESVMALPLFYQSWLRLVEIKGRIEL